MCYYNFYTSFSFRFFFSSFHHLTACCYVVVMMWKIIERRKRKSALCEFSSLWRFYFGSVFFSSWSHFNVNAREGARSLGGLNDHWDEVLKVSFVLSAIQIKKEIYYPICKWVRKECFINENVEFLICGAFISFVATHKLFKLQKLFDQILIELKRVLVTHLTITPSRLFSFEDLKRKC